MRLVSVVPAPRRSQFLLLACVGLLLSTPACNAKLFGSSSAASAAPTPPDSVLLALCASIPLPVSDSDADDRADNGDDDENESNQASVASPSNNGNGNNSELALFLRLSSDSEKKRSDAAKKLLRHAAKRSPAALESAIFVEGTLGDFRVLADLDHIVVNQIASDEQPAIAYDFGIPVRTGAAAAIGRIIEQDRSVPPGRPADHNDLDDEPGTGHTDVEPAIDDSDIRAAVASLEFASCPGKSIELRGAALEALGLIRDPSAKAFLDAVAANPGEGDESSNLFLTTIAARSLTNITLNNHVLTLGLMPRIDALFDQAQGSQVTP